MNIAEIWTHINETLKVLAIPGTVAFVAFMFRKQIGERISSVLKAKAIGTEWEFESKTLELNMGISPASEVLTPPVEAVDRALGEPVTAAEASADVRVEAAIQATADVERSEDLLERREQIEGIIHASFRSGYDAGSSGVFQGRPDPYIRWTGSTPEVIGWGMGDLPAHYIRGITADRPETEWADRVRRLEDEIRRLRERGVSASKANTADWRLYQELLEKLRREDPDSPFA